MREIKFRAWDLEKRRWAHPVVVRSQLMQPYMLSVEWRNGVTYLSHECDEGATIELQQYTGLKDRHGKEIYEGDIVKKSYPKSKPQRRSIVFAIEYKELFDNEMGYSLGICFDFHGYGSHELEVIGNIYENPELLEEIL